MKMKVMRRFKKSKKYLIDPKALLLKKTLVKWKIEPGNDILKYFLLYIHFFEFSDNHKSIITKAAILSTIGGALGSTHGSCLPFVSNIIDFPSNVCVYCGNPILDTGLKATLK